MYVVKNGVGRMLEVGNKEWLVVCYSTVVGNGWERFFDKFVKKSK